MTRSCTDMSPVIEAMISSLFSRVPRNRYLVGRGDKVLDTVKVSEFRHKEYIMIVCQFVLALLSVESMVEKFSA